MTKTRRSFALAAAFVVALAVGGPAAATAAMTTGDGSAAPTAPAQAPAQAQARDGERGTPPPRIVRATREARVAPLDPPSSWGHATVLEGPALGPDGRLYFVDFTAPAGHPKILRYDPRTKQVTPLHTDATSRFSSLQFSPADGKIYVTDYDNGKIDRIDPDGGGFTTVFSGPVDGRVLVPDDIAFNKAGDMYITDYHGSLEKPDGRVVRLDARGAHPVVLQNGLSGPNGISFTPDFSALWVSEYNLGREDHFTLAPDGRSITAGGVGMSADVGGGGFDSNSVDSAGNVYQVVLGDGKILVWNPAGDLLATVVIPQRPQPEPLVSNLVIKPGSTHGYITVGGDNGGYLYTFRALAPGLSQPANHQELSGRSR
ncbi:SMP-30/gluconolactonase/LRE family protein [Streptomyces sp. SID10853]|uniref:SMP-30/gluconolactonase/LRE family protein n=1 Tax=Streptomyces sp. SID10853 TaxID=2706028 RepID=UPI0013C2245D|nr:SMP-30/gluconolactonase/LRE family protein [Streptomyces sp. SID10853]NDZ78663.1 SMP-30/gluconolactonase/LRE family protein [Streptomyces sp. SID10853]